MCAYTEACISCSLLLLCAPLYTGVVYFCQDDATWYMCSRLPAQRRIRRGILSLELCSGNKCLGAVMRGKAVCSPRSASSMHMTRWQIGTTLAPAALFQCMCMHGRTACWTFTGSKFVSCNPLRHVGATFDLCLVHSHALARAVSGMCIYLPALLEMRQTHTYIYTYMLGRLSTFPAPADLLDTAWQWSDCSIAKASYELQCSNFHSDHRMHRHHASHSTVMCAS